MRCYPFPLSPSAAVLFLALVHSSGGKVGSDVGISLPGDYTTNQVNHALSAWRSHFTDPLRTSKDQSITARFFRLLFSFDALGDKCPPRSRSERKATTKGSFTYLRYDHFRKLRTIQEDTSYLLLRMTDCPSTSSQAYAKRASGVHEPRSGNTCM